MQWVLGFEELLFVVADRAKSEGDCCFVEYGGVGNGREIEGKASSERIWRPWSPQSTLSEHESAAWALKRAGGLQTINHFFWLSFLCYGYFFSLKNRSFPSNDGWHKKP